MTLDIKLCGLKSEQALETALDCGATHIGFIFFEKSPRHVEPRIAAALRRKAEGRALTVAVTVDADNERLDTIVETVNPDMLQLHGSESPDRAAGIKARYGLPVMKAFSLDKTGDLAKIADYRNMVDRFLFDAKPPAGSQIPGGNGVSFDWRMLTTLDRDIDYMLSGGLNAANIGEALQCANPSGIDISSGVESAPGVKDKALIADFFKAVRHARAQNAA